MTAELVALTEELQATRQMLGVVLTRLDTADKRANRHRFMTTILALCVFAVAALGGLYAIDQRDDERRACLQANEARADIRQAIVNTVEVIVAGADDPSDFETLLDEIANDLVRTLPDREC